MIVAAAVASGPSALEVVSLTAGITGTVLTTVGIAVSVFLYRKAKYEASRAEAAIGRTLEISEESSRLLEVANHTLAATSTRIEVSHSAVMATQATLNETSNRLALLLEQQAILVSSSTTETFLETLLQSAEDAGRDMTVGDLMEAIGRTAWTKRDADEALTSLDRLNRLSADGPMHALDTPIRLRRYTGG